MNILALDTSSEYCSAALLCDGHILQSLEHAGQRHSQRLLPMVQELLAEAGLVLAALDGIAVSLGPGSFTGVRIAAAVGQGIAYGADLPVGPVGSLEAMAWGTGHAAVIACADARMGEVYFAAYRREGGGLAETIAPCVVPPAEVPVPGEGAWHAAGSGFAVHGTLLAARLWGRVSGVDPDAVVQAQFVASLAAARWPAGFVEPPEALQPTYVRDKVALTMAER